MPSLLTGRNRAPLTAEQIKRVTHTFLGLSNQVNVRHDPGASTAFRVSVDDAGHHFGEVVFGPDIYPGIGVVDPNGSLSLLAAAAHELTHYNRWQNLTALDGDHLLHLDEALTSLQAISYFFEKLGSSEIRQLSADAMQRLQLYLAQMQNGG